MVRNAVVPAVVLAISLGCATHRGIATPDEVHSHIWALARCFDDAADSYAWLSVTWEDCVYFDLERDGHDRIIWAYDSRLGAQVDETVRRLRRVISGVYRRHPSGHITAGYMAVEAIRDTADELRGLIPETYAAP